MCRNISSINTVAAKALYTIGHYEGLGFSPFSIQQIPGVPFSPKEEKLANVYDIMSQIKPILDKNWGQGKIEAVLLDKDDNKAAFTLGDYEFTAVHTHNLGWEAEAKSDEWEQSAAMIIQNGDNEFYYAGFGVSIKAKNPERER